MARVSMFAEEIPATAEQHGKLHIDRYEFTSTRTGVTTLAVKIWRGKATKPYAHFTFKSEAHRERYIEQEKNSHDVSERYAVERKIERQAAVAQLRAEIVVGTLLVYSWGYEQTNVDFSQVVDRKGSTIKVRAIAQREVEGSEGFMSNRVMPARDHFVGEEVLTKRITNNGIKMGHGHAHVCTDNSTHYQSWYA